MIKLRDINKSYGDLRVLRDISLSIDKGEIVAITGPSGAGKTTLLQIMGTLDRPDSGIVDYNGTNVSSLNDKELSRFRNRNIGFVFQFHQLLPEFTLLENVAMPAMIGNAPRQGVMSHARELLDYLGLGQRLEHKPAQLSGGECQRAAVARALINHPEVILADEPSGSLDSANRDELQKLFSRLRSEMGQTIVIVTHDQQLAARADRIIQMRDGRII